MNAFFVALLFVRAALSATIENPNIQADGPACPIKNPLPIEAGPLNITAGHPDDILVDIKVGSRHEGGVAVGLDKLKYSYTINLITMTVTFEMNNPGQVCLDGGKYKANGALDFSPFHEETLPNGIFEGSGSYHACMSNAHISGSVSLKVNLITQEVEVTKINIVDIKSDDVEVDLGHFVVDGTVVDWQVWSANFEERFESEWPTVGAEFLERARAGVNHVIKGYTLQELIDLIGGGDEPCEPEM